jgi:hypothetical protein
MDFDKDGKVVVPITDATGEKLNVGDTVICHGTVTSLRGDHIGFTIHQVFRGFTDIQQAMARDKAEATK